MTTGKARPVVAPPWVFYSSPFCVKGMWIRADICTAQVACPWKECGSKQWEPCRQIRLGNDLPGSTLMNPKCEYVVGGYMGTSHHERRKAAAKLSFSSLTIQVRTAGGPPAGGYTIALALPPTVPTQEDEVGSSEIH